MGYINWLESITVIGKPARMECKEENRIGLQRMRRKVEVSQVNRYADYKII